uniref:Uncharacterized protein n=1 Tax=viral metagenome TaxID=1070528 RepID=A0A6M3KXS5_9ZZZZ
MKNKKAFMKLIKRYESITIEEIREVNKRGYRYLSSEDILVAQSVQNELTGFGSYKTCTLCKAINDDCKECVYIHCTGCICSEGANVITFDQIYTAKNAKKLLAAYIERAKHMRMLIDDQKQKKVI